MLRASSSNTVVDPKPTQNSNLATLSEALIEACRQGNNAAFRHLYQQYKLKVASTVRYLIGPSPDLEDVVQTVFLEIFRSIKKYKGESRLSTWIYRVTVNVSLQYIRKQTRHRKHLYYNLRNNDDWPQKHELKVNPIGRLEDREILTKIYQNLDSLSVKKRTVFILHELKQMSIDDIAEIVNTSVNTVKSRLFHARKELMERMKRRRII